jgi:hypothetical protein
MPKPPLFADLADDDLLGYGVPAEWLADVRAANEDNVLDLADHLPGEAAKALLELATGGTPQNLPGGRALWRPVRASRCPAPLPRDERRGRSGTISLFNGPLPTIDSFDTPESEIKAVSQWLQDRNSAGIEPEEIGIFVRSAAELPRARAAIEKTGLTRC